MINNTIDIPMPIITPRRIMRPIQIEDAKAFYEAKVESYDELYPWRIWVAGCDKENLSVEADEAFCKKRQKLFSLGENIMLMVFNRETNKFIGDTGINKPDWRLKLFKTGYWVRTSEMGKGYATEMATAIARYVFLALGAKKLSITHAEGNDASARVISKVGYDKEGVLRKCHELPNNKLVDEHHYSLLGLDNVPEMDIKWGVQ